MTTKNRITSVVVIDYCMGNVASVTKAIDALGIRNKLSDKKSDIDKATHIVLPGVGAFGDGMSNLKNAGLIEILSQRVLKDQTPFLGICLGMQLLASKGHEFGEHKGLGWIEGEVVKLKSPRLPHVGWNDVRVVEKNTLFKDIPDYNFYFVHSYRFKPKNKNIVTSYCTYGETFPSSIRKNNIIAVQFHPEKSQLSGLTLLKNFLAM